MKLCFFCFITFACYNGILLANKSNIVPQKTINSVVFDLDGVLFTTDRIRLMGEVGLWPSVKYLSTQRSLPNREKFFDILHHIPHISQVDSYNEDKMLPGLLVDWLTGVSNNKKLIAQATKSLNSTNIDDAVRRWVLSILGMMFDAKRFVATRMPLPEGHQLVKDLKKYRKLKLYVLSNWDQESFKVLKTVYADFFALFDGIVISGDTKLLKPQKEIFNYLLSYYKISVDETLFIDDEKNNATAASKLGFQTYHLTKQLDYNKVKDLVLSRI